MKLKDRFHQPRRLRTLKPPPGGEAMFSEDDFFAVRAALERMSDSELAEFRKHPANRSALRQYDRFAMRLVWPYAAALTLVWLVSLVMGAWLSVASALPWVL